MDDWHLFSDPRFAMRFRYPRLAADGEPVGRLETQQTGMLRVHIFAPQTRQVYFEVSKYDRLTSFAEYERHRDDLLTRFDLLSISELREAQCASLPAQEYTVDWDQGRRVVVLAEQADALYRILYDPSLAINLQILSTLEWVM